MKLICPKCFEEYEVDENLIGQRVECVCGKKWNLLPFAQEFRANKLFGYKIGTKIAQETAVNNLFPVKDSIYGIKYCSIKFDNENKIQEISGAAKAKKVKPAILLTKQILICLCRMFGISPYDFREYERNDENFTVKYKFERQENNHLKSLLVSRLPLSGNEFLINVMLLDIGPDFKQDLGFIDNIVSPVSKYKPEESDFDFSESHTDFDMPVTTENVIQKYPQFAGVCFGKNCPTQNQFSYALHLGIDVSQKTFSTISTAIDRAKASSRRAQPIQVDLDDEDVLYEYLVSVSPASKEYMDELKEYHADLPREITNGEAEKILDFLEHHKINCPFCHKVLDSTLFSLDSCIYCDKSFKDLKIPIYIV